MDLRLAPTLNLGTSNQVNSPVLALIPIEQSRAETIIQSLVGSSDVELAERCSFEVHVKSATKDCEPDGWNN